MSTYAHTCNDSPLYKFIKIEVIKEKKIIKQTSIPIIFYLDLFFAKIVYFLILLRIKLDLSLPRTLLFK